MFFFFMNLSKTYVLNDLLNGYHSYDKLSNIYKDLQKELLPVKPLHESLDSLVTIKTTWRGAQYGWQLFAIDESVLLIEYYGRWQGYASDPLTAPHITKSSLNKLSITLHNPKDIFTKKIEDILKNYPEK
jgi:hypothetical protein